MTNEEKYKKALSEIENIISFVEEQDHDDINEELAKKQDVALYDIYKIVEDILKGVTKVRI